MRSGVVVATAVLLSACAGGGQTRTFTGPVVGSSTQAFDCVTRQLGAMGYVPTSSDPDRGAVRAERMDEQPWWLRVIGFNDAVDVLDVSLQGTPARLTAGAYTQVVRNQRREAAAPSDEARTDAHTLLSTCGRA